jgi:hypothetical protein
MGRWPALVEVEQPADERSARSRGRFPFWGRVYHPPVRRAALLVSCWLIAGLAWAGRPFGEDVLGGDGGGLPDAPLDGLFVALALAYAALLFCLRYIPDRVWWLRPALALTPMLLPAIDAVARIT